MATHSDPRAPGFLLLFKNAGEATHAHLTAEQKATLTKQWNDWYDGLAKAGKVKHGQPLEGAGRVVANVNGRITDGPFAESKEAIGGYFYLTVESLDEATAIARECPGLAIGVEVEVRPLAVVSPVLNEVHGRPPAAS